MFVGTQAWEVGYEYMRSGGKTCQALATRGETMNRMVRGRNHVPHLFPRYHRWAILRYGSSCLALALRYLASFASEQQAWQDSAQSPKNFSTKPLTASLA